MRIKTTRFGDLEVGSTELIQFPEGILGFSDLTQYCLVDPSDDTLVLWLQSIQDSSVAFPVLEPKIFKTDYVAKLSSQELKDLKLESVNQSIVFTILTIPKDVSQMTANLKAPIVVNLKEQIGRQVVLQENEYSLKAPMFKELKTQLVTIQSNRPRDSAASSSGARPATSLPINIRSMVPSNQIKTL